MTALGGEGCEDTVWGRRIHGKVVGALNCVSWWSQNIRGSELRREVLVVECKNLETEAMHSYSDNILELNMERGSVPWICCSILLSKLFKYSVFQYPHL